MSWSADIFHVGPQKTGTTWVYQCFREHPEVNTSRRDAIHYYDLFYFKGNEWYRHQFATECSAKLGYDPTYTYFRSPVVPRRIVRDNPHAKVIVCVREPIERAFSHYWHEKKKGRFNFSFDEVFENFDLFTNWIEPGFYSVHLERFQKYFSSDQIKVVMFDDLERDPRAFISGLYRFAGVSTNFVPSIVDTKINIARPRLSWVQRLCRHWNLSEPAKSVGELVRLADALGARHGSGYVETLDDVPVGTMIQLIDVVESELEKLEKLLDVDLSVWRQRYDSWASKGS